ncbi:MAG: asparaginase [Gemmatimonadaceae bacterium]|nr:asparaginase [Gemmatimonadaceae bacterium]
MLFSAASASQVPSATVDCGPSDVTTMLDVIVTRGDLVESRHRVHAAVVDWKGQLRMAARNPQLTTWWRSCAKPFQVMPMLDNGQFRALGWGPDELALACASHGGEPEHVALAGAMLSAIGLEEGDLACGPHEPLSSRGARILRESGHRVTRLHNNCSGKHTAMLARAVLEHWPTVGYERHTHPVQQAARDAVSTWTGVAPDAIPVAVDGCGVTVFALPLANMALSYARLGHAARRGDAAPAQIVAAMTGQPFLVGGTDRFDTLLMEACGGRVLCKIGAEGVHTLALLEQGIGMAVKVEDGAHRAQYPAVLALLAALGELPDPLPDALRDLTGRQVRNTRGEVVGEIRVSAIGVGHLVVSAGDAST